MDARADSARIVKLVSTSSEACGISTADMVEGRLATHSYFDGEGDRTPLLGMDAADYIAIVETVGRRPDPRKRGMIPPHMRSTLEGLRIDVDRWLAVVTSPARLFGTAIGSAASLAREAARRGMKWIVGALDVCVAS